MPKLYIGNAAVLSLYATGRTTGTVIDVGEGITHAVPIYEGYCIPHAVTKIPICGDDLTRYLHSMLHPLHPTQIENNLQGFEECVKIKETRGKVALDFDAELKQVTDAMNGESLYKLPTGHKISVSESCLRCPELLFSPSISAHCKIEDGL